MAKQNNGKHSIDKQTRFQNIADRAEKVEKETKDKLEKAILEVSKEMQALSSLEKGELPKQEDMEKLVTALRQSMSQAEYDSMFASQYPPVPLSATIEKAVNNYVGQEKDDGKVDDLLNRIQKIRDLFFPKINVVLESNKNYRDFIANGPYILTVDNLSHVAFFSKERLWDSSLDIEKIEKQIRRLDSEFRALDLITKEEFIFDFVEVILQYVGMDRTHPPYTASHGYKFSMFSKESQDLLGNILAMYLYVKEYGRVYINTRNKDSFLSDKNIDKLIAFGKQRPHSLKNSRMIGKDFSPSQIPATILDEREYVTVMRLEKALSAALPESFADAVIAAFMRNSRYTPGIDPHRVEGEIAESSKYLRNNFIALSQNHGSFENFFTTLYHYYKALNSHLNSRARLCRVFVGVYDSLGIDIATALEESRTRLTQSYLPF